MRYTVTKQIVQVIGHIWQPDVGVCATSISLDVDWMQANGYDPASRDDVEQWILLHNTGDFRQVLDWRADLHIGDTHVVHDWASEDSEFADFPVSFTQSIEKRYYRQTI